MDFVTCTKYLGEGAEGSDLLDGSRKVGVRERRVIEQAGAEQPPNFSKAEDAMRVVLLSGTSQGPGFQEMSLKSTLLQSFLDQLYKMSGFF